MKKCATPDCGLKELSEFHDDRTRYDRKNQYCKSCVSNRRKKWVKDNPDPSRKKNSAYYRKCKQETMSHYGGFCQCCGESRIDFLTLDHINQDGAEQRRKMGFNNSCTGFGFYLWLRKQNWPDLGLQVLCANCNTARGFCRECPHVKDREPSLIDGSGI